MSYVSGKKIGPYGPTELWEMWRQKKATNIKNKTKQNKNALFEYFWFWFSFCLKPNYVCLLITEKKPAEILGQRGPIVVKGFSCDWKWKMSL